MLTYTPFIFKRATTVLGVIFYTMDDFTVLGDGTLVLDNAGTSGDTNQGIPYASNHIYLDGITQEVDYPILHDLGSDLAVFPENTLGAGLDVTVNGTALDVLVAEENDSQQQHIYLSSSGLSMGTWELEVTYSNNNIAGSYGVRVWADGTEYLAVTEYLITNSTQKITYEFVASEALTDFRFYPFMETANTGAVLNDSITIVAATVKEVTLPTSSYFTYYDSTTKIIKRLSSVGAIGNNDILNPFTLSTKYEADEVSSITYIEGILNVNVTVAGTNHIRPTQTILMANDFKYNTNYTFRFNAVVLSGTPILTTFVFGGTSGNNTVNHTIANGVNELQVSSKFESSEERIFLEFDGRNLFNIDMSGIELVEGMPISTVYTLDRSHQLAHAHSVAYSEADATAIESNPNILLDVVFNSYTLPSGFSETDLHNFYAGNEGETSVEKVYDITDGTWATYASIINYTSPCRTNLDRLNYGATNLKIIQDASGRSTGTVADGFTRWENDSRTVVTQWTISAPFTITEDIDGDIYTFTSDGNRYKNSAADGSYSVPTGTWTLDDTAFDDVTAVVLRGETKMIEEVKIP